MLYKFKVRVAFVNSWSITKPVDEITANNNGISCEDDMSLDIILPLGKYSYDLTVTVGFKAGKR